MARSIRIQDHLPPLIPCRSVLTFWPGSVPPGILAYCQGLKQWLKFGSQVGVKL